MFNNVNDVNQHDVTNVNVITLLLLMLATPNHKQQTLAADDKFSMKKTTNSVDRLQDMLKHGSRKRKHIDSPENEALTPAKRRRVMFMWPPMPKTFYLKVKQWHDRKEKVELGIALFWEAQKQNMADKIHSPPVPTMSLSEEALDGIKAAEILIEEITHEIEASAPKHQIIKRLDVNSTAVESLEVKAVPLKRRGGFRKKGEKRLHMQ